MLMRLIFVFLLVGCAPWLIAGGQPQLPAAKTELLGFEQVIRGQEQRVLQSTHGANVIKFRSMYDLPVSKGQVEQYAQKYHTTFSLTQQNLKLEGDKGGGGCGHSPVCIIVVPFILLDLVSGYEDYDVATFSVEGALVLTVYYHHESGLLAKVQLADARGPMTIRYSQFLDTYFIEQKPGQDIVDIGQQLFSRLGDIDNDEQLAMFEHDAALLPYQPAPWILAQRAIESNTYTPPQRDSLLRLMCLEHRYGREDSRPYATIINHSMSIDDPVLSYALLECLSPYGNILQAHTVNVKKLFSTVVTGICEDKITWQRSPYAALQALNIAHKKLLPSTPASEVFQCSEPTFTIYQRYIAHDTISTADHLYLYQQGEPKGIDFATRLPLEMDTVLRARLALAIDKKIRPRELLDELIERPEITLTHHFDALLALYHTDNYKSYTFLLFNELDTDITKQSWLSCYQH